MRALRSRGHTRGGWGKALAKGALVSTLLACLGLVAGAPSVLTTPPSALPSAIPSGYFRVAVHNGVWWLIDPLGAPTLSIGVDNVTYEGDRIRGMGPSPYLQAAEKIYPNRAAWGRSALKRLHAWGFNTLGAWSDRELWGHSAPYTVMLDFAARAGADWLRGRPVDVYDPRFEDAALEIARREATPRARDPMLVGYFSDNELWWGPDWRRRDTMLAAYLSFPPDAPGRQRAVDFLHQRYGTVQRLNHAWHVAAPDFSRLPPTADAPAYRADANAFLELVAIRYFTVSAAVIRSADPNHLYLGARFAGEPPDPVLRAARAADVVSINLYDRDPRRAVTHVFALAGRPVLVTEFSFRALDSGLPNTIGAGPWVFTQQGRARAYGSYVARLASVPQAIGYHWFRWADEPREGRADGENSNYGLVNLKDAPYAPLVHTVTAANQAAVEVHRGAARAIAIPAESRWYHGTPEGIVNTLLGGPRWVLTAIRTLSAYLARASSQAHT